MAAQQEVMLGEINNAWQELQESLARVPPEHTEDAGVVGPWSVKDLIGHITTWENEALKSVRQCLAHGDPKMLRWPDLDAFNERTVESKRATPLADSIRQWLDQVVSA